MGAVGPGGAKAFAHRCRGRADSRAIQLAILALLALTTSAPPRANMVRATRSSSCVASCSSRAVIAKKPASAKPVAQAAAKPAAKKAAKKARPPHPLAHASRAREEAAWAAGTLLVVGSDEAGRGPLAGPVVAAACALPASAAPIPGVGDSKTITDEAERERLYEAIIATPGVRWSARVVGAERIDDINILMASLEAMRLSVVDVLTASPEKAAIALIDGPYSPWKEGPKYVDFQSPAPPVGIKLSVEPIKGGDAKCYCIAAASILAKVTRDRIMHAYHTEWPAYGLAQHKGYPTGAHMAAIAKHGLRPWSPAWRRGSPARPRPRCSGRPVRHPPPHLRPAQGARAAAAERGRGGEGRGHRREPWARAKSGIE